MFLRISTAVQQLAEVDALISTHGARITSSKLHERYRTVVAAAGAQYKKNAGFKVKKGLTVAVTVSIPEDYAEGGGAIAALEHECLIGTSEESLLQMRTCEIEFTLGVAYLAESGSSSDSRSSDICLATCTSSYFADDSASAAFNASLRDFLCACAGCGACLADAVEFVEDNVAHHFARLYSSVWLEISIGGEVAGRIECELSRRLCPITTENFEALCTGARAGRERECSKPLCYRGCHFWRIVPGQFAHAGDFSRGGLYGGSSNESIFAAGNSEGTGLFDDENHLLRHTRAGTLSMANAGPNTNGSQFFFACREGGMRGLDGKHVCFGVVRNEEGMRLLNRMQEQAVPSGKVKTPVVITDCGKSSEAFT